MNEHLLSYWRPRIPVVRSPIASSAIIGMTSLGLMRYDTGRYVIRPRMLTDVPGRKTGNVELNQEQASARQSSSTLTLLKFGLSALAIGVIVFTVDLAAAWQRMVNQNPWLVVMAAGVMVVQIGLGGLRWHVILRRLGVSAAVPDSLRLFYIAVFFNATLWGGVVAGDVVRAWLSYRARVSAGMAVSSVVLDRVAAVAGVSLLVLATAPLLVDRVGHVLTALIPAGIAAAGLVGIAAVALIGRLPVAWHRNRVLRGLQTLSRATRTIFLHPASALPALGLAVSAQTAMALCAFVLAASLNIELSLLDCLILMQPVALITALPISVGGWGVRETAMIGLFSLVGVPASAALALSMQLGLLAILVSLPGAIFWMRLKDQKAEARSQA